LLRHALTVYAVASENNTDLICVISGDETVEQVLGLDGPIVTDGQDALTSRLEIRRPVHVAMGGRLCLIDLRGRCSKRFAGEAMIIQDTSDQDVTPAAIQVNQTKKHIERPILLHASTAGDETAFDEGSPYLVGETILHVVSFLGEVRVGHQMV
jgi:hypothetical protein